MRIEIRRQSPRKAGTRCLTASRKKLCKLFAAAGLAYVGLMGAASIQGQSPAPPVLAPAAESNLTPGSLPSAKFNASYDLKPRPAELVEPGLEIKAGQPPQGWTDLVIKTQPKVTQGDIAKAGKLDIELASAFFTVMVANVDDAGEAAAAGERFRLSRLGIGVGTNIQGRDTIISPDTQAKLGANLGFIPRLVLKSFYQEQQDVRILVSSPALWVVDSPVVMRMKDHNEVSLIRHALVLDRASGKLQRGCWLLLLNKEGDPRGLAGKLEWLKEGHQENAELYLDKREYRLGMATKQAYGLINPPLGVASTEVGEGQLSFLCARPFESAQIRKLEDLLRQGVRLAKRM